MQALKSLVIFMGVLIAIGVTVIGVTIYRRATDMASDEKAVPAGASSPSAPSSSMSASMPLPAGQSAAPAPNFGMRSLDLPPGSIIVSVQPFESRVLAHVRLIDGGTSILLLDPATGDVTGEWRAFGDGAAGAQVPTRPQPAQR